MRPKSEPKQVERELFQSELEQIIDLRHPLVRLGTSLDWASFESALGATYHPTQGAPGTPTRLIVALHYLKHQYDLSDEDVVLHWLENPYWQHFSGERYFQHRLPIDASSMTRWRQRLGEAGAEQMLRGTIAAGIRLGAVRSADLKRINVDTTVQTKAVRYGTTVKWPGVPGSLTATGNEGVVRTLAGTPYSVGYVGASYETETVRLSVRKVPMFASLFRQARHPAVLGAVFTPG